MKNIYETVKNTIKLLKLSKFNTFKSISIPEIPTEWTKFDDFDGKWVKIELPLSENKVGCIYHGEKDSIFPPHKHSVGEHFTIMNPKGKVEVITKSESIIISFPNSYYFKTNEVHAVKFITSSKLFITWDEMVGWDADFILK